MCSTRMCLVSICLFAMRRTTTNLLNTGLHMTVIAGREGQGKASELR